MWCGMWYGESTARKHGRAKWTKWAPVSPVPALPWVTVTHDRKMAGNRRENSFEPRDEAAHLEVVLMDVAAWRLLSGGHGPPVRLPNSLTFSFSMSIGSSLDDDVQHVPDVRTLPRAAATGTTSTRSPTLGRRGPVRRVFLPSGALLRGENPELIRLPRAEGGARACAAVWNSNFSTASLAPRPVPRDERRLGRTRVSRAFRVYGYATRALALEDVVERQKYLRLGAVGFQTLPSLHVGNLHQTQCTWCGAFCFPRECKAFHCCGARGELYNSLHSHLDDGRHEVPRGLRLLLPEWNQFGELDDNDIMRLPPERRLQAREMQRRLRLFRSKAVQLNHAVAFASTIAQWQRFDGPGAGSYGQPRVLNGAVVRYLASGILPRADDGGTERRAFGELYFAHENRGDDVLRLMQRLRVLTGRDCSNVLGPSQPGGLDDLDFADSAEGRDEAACADLLLALENDILQNHEYALAAGRAVDDIDLLQREEDDELQAVHRDGREHDDRAVHVVLRQRHRVRGPRGAAARMPGEGADDDIDASGPQNGQVLGAFNDGGVAGARELRREFQVVLHGQPRRLSFRSPLVLPLVYPVAFPRGSPGWSPHLGVTIRHYFAYTMQRRDPRRAVQPTARDWPLRVGKLTQQLWVEMWALTLVSIISGASSPTAQTQMMADTYQNVAARADSIANSGSGGAGVVPRGGRRIVIPPSVLTGCPRDMQRRYKNVMVMVSAYGMPNFLVTLTCNPNWPEIVDSLPPGTAVIDAPDIVSRVFRAKLDLLLAMLDGKHGQPLLGHLNGYTSVVEFQARGLPHAHMLLWLRDHVDIDNVGQYVQAFLPDVGVDATDNTDAARQGVRHLRELVLAHQVHHHGRRCGHYGCSILANGERCGVGYPMPFSERDELVEIGDGITALHYRRPYESVHVYHTHNGQRRREVRSDMVVPYNAALLAMWQGHVNMEMVRSAKSVKYLLGYIFKGQHRASIERQRRLGNTATSGDEGEYLLNVSIISPPEACFRLLGLKLFNQSHSVQVLPVHLPDEQAVILQDSDLAEQEVRERLARSRARSPLLAYFRLNQYERNDPQGRRAVTRYRRSGEPCAADLTYDEVVSWYTSSSDGANQRDAAADGDDADAADDAAQAGGTDQHAREVVWRRRNRNTTRGHHQGARVLARIHDVPVSAGEKYFLALLLRHVRGPTSYESLRTVDGVVYDTFHEACAALHIVSSNDAHHHAALAEAAESQPAETLRRLFATMLLFGDVRNPTHLWREFGNHCAQDYADERAHQVAAPLGEQRALVAVEPTADDRNRALADIDLHLLVASARYASDFGLHAEPASPDAVPSSGSGELDRRQVRLERLLRPLRISFSSDEMRDEFRRSVQERVEGLNADQRIVYDRVVREVMQAARQRSSARMASRARSSSSASHLFVLQAAGGTGKTYLINLLRDTLKMRGLLAVPCATSGIAALLLGEGAGTLHRWFGVPLELHNDSVSHLSIDSANATVLRDAHLVIIDEAFMMSTQVYAVVDRFLRHVRDMPNVPFGGACVLFTGDVKQCLPVVPGATRDGQVALTLHHATWWGDVERLALRQNMRVQAALARVDARAQELLAPLGAEEADGDDRADHTSTVHEGELLQIEADRQRIQHFSEFIHMVGYGTRHAVSGERERSQHVPIPDELLVEFNERAVAAARDEDAGIRIMAEPLIAHVFGGMSQSLLSNGTVLETDEGLEHAVQLSRRCIVASTNSQVYTVNNMVLDRFQCGEPADAVVLHSVDYYSSEVGAAMRRQVPLHILNQQSVSGVPPHRLRLKVGCIVSLMRNVDPVHGLCNNTRLQVLQINDNSIRARVCSGPASGQVHSIVRIVFHCSPTYQRRVIPMCRLQFPLQLAFACTVHRVQGQTLDRVGVLIYGELFTHGQLYVAVSRVGDPNALRIAARSLDNLNQGRFAHLQPGATPLNAGSTSSRGRPASRTTVRANASLPFQIRNPVYYDVIAAVEGEHVYDVAPGHGSDHARGGSGDVDGAPGTAAVAASVAAPAAGAAANVHTTNSRAHSDADSTPARTSSLGRRRRAPDAPRQPRRVRPRHGQLGCDQTLTEAAAHAAAAAAASRGTEAPARGAVSASAELSDAESVQTRARPRSGRRRQHERLPHASRSRSRPARRRRLRPSTYFAVPPFAPNSTHSWLLVPFCRDVMEWPRDESSTQQLEQWIPQDVWQALTAQARVVWCALDEQQRRELMPRAGDVLASGYFGAYDQERIFNVIASQAPAVQQFLLAVAALADGQRRQAHAFAAQTRVLAQAAGLLDD